MHGAKEYASIFESGQYGRLFLVSGRHARGKTFHIWVLPDETPIQGMPWRAKDAVEVYGIAGGQPGWSEWYGWLHRGKWEEDFAALVEARRAELAAGKAQQAREKEGAEAAERQRIATLLAKY